MCVCVCMYECVCVCVGDFVYVNLCTNVPASVLACVCVIMPV